MPASARHRGIRHGTATLPARRTTMSRGTLIGVIVVLAIVALVTSYLYYQERQTGIDIQIDEQGITIDGN